MGHGQGLQCGECEGNILASTCGRGWIKVWEVVKQQQQQQYRLALSFHHQCVRAFTCCVITKRARIPGGFTAICGHSDGSLLLLKGQKSCKPRRMGSGRDGATHRIGGGTRAVPVVETMRCTHSHAARVSWTNVYCRPFKRLFKADIMGIFI